MDRKKRNTILLGIVLAVLLAGGLLVQKYLLSKPGMVAVVQLEGRELYRLDLQNDTSVMVPALNGGYNIITVENGAVFVPEADCPDLTCVRTGKAMMPGQVIACLPHRLIIYVEEGT